MEDSVATPLPEASSRPLPSIQDQQDFWDWHWLNWEQRKVMNDWTERRAQEILSMVRGLHLPHPRIIDFGCGRGWFTERLADLGETHGIDLSPEGIAAAQARRSDIRYIAGNIYDADLPKNYFDVLVSQEVIAHVENQPRYVERACEVLKPGGFLIITTGNKFVMDRLGDVGWNIQPPQHIAHQLGRPQLRRMVEPYCRVLSIDTFIPHGQLGILRLVNSYKLNALLSSFIPQQKLDRLREKAGFGWQQILLAEKRS
jgi:SAM-dependent methyltransferase